MLLSPGHMRSLQCALESPFYGSALAGCRWESAFFSTSEVDAGAGLRLSFQAFADNVEAFASDCAKAIAAHLVSGEAFVERGRRLALAELRGEKELRKALEELRADALQVDF